MSKNKEKDNIQNDSKRSNKKDIYYISGDTGKKCDFCGKKSRSCKKVGHWMVCINCLDKF